MTPLPPDARLRAPKRPLPPGTVDCHAHIFDRPDRYAFSKTKKYAPPICRREDWLALHASLGVERGVQVHGSPYGFDNSITRGFPLGASRDDSSVSPPISPEVEEARIEKAGCVRASGPRA